MSGSAPKKHGPVGAEALLPFAEGHEGRIVHVSSVPNGKRCGCLCPECRAPLIAYHGRKKAWHFGHFTGANCNPSRALETMLHRLAKQLIADRGEVWLPPVYVTHGGSAEILHEGGVFRPEQVRLEKAVPGMRPDIIATRGNRTLFIEVAVRHKVDADKLALIRERKQPTIEIDLEKWRYETDEEVLERAILTEAPRYWLFNATKHEAEEAIKARHEKLLQERRDRATRIAERIARSLDQPKGGDPGGREAWANAVNIVVTAGLARDVGFPIPGDDCFAVSAEIWQAVCMARLLAAQMPGLAGYDSAWKAEQERLLRPAVREAQRNDDRDWKVISEITAGRVLDPYEVVTGYCEFLRQRGRVDGSRQTGFALSWETGQRAKDALLQQAAQRQRLTSLQGRFQETCASVGSPSVSFEAWLGAEYEGLTATPGRLAREGGHAFFQLLEQLRRIAALGTPDAPVVSGTLLGFPAEEHQAARAKEAARRQQKIEDERRAKAAAEEVERLRQAAHRLKEMRDAIAQIGEDGDPFLTEPLPGLGGKSIEALQGWMTDAEATWAWHAIERRRETVWRQQEEAAAAASAIRDWQDRLRRDVSALLGPDRAEAVLRSPYPETQRRKLIDFCKDEQTYRICIAVAQAVKRRR